MRIQNSSTQGLINISTYIHNNSKYFARSFKLTMGRRNIKGANSTVILCDIVVILHQQTLCLVEMLLHVALSHQIINLFTISLELLMADRIVQQSMITLFMMVVML